MISYANRKDTAYGIRSFVLDTNNDVQDLPMSKAGSTAYVISSGKRYICNSLGEWKEVVAASGGNGNSSGGNTNPGGNGNNSSDSSDEIIYDGGELGSEDDEYHILYDGGLVL